MTGRHATKGCAFIREHGVRSDHHRPDPLLLDGYEDLLELAFTARVQHLQMPIVVVAAFARAAAFPKAGMTATMRKKRRYVFWLRDRYQH
jgi:hypothetical protein